MAQIPTNNGIQQLRGLAALAVVLCHYGSSLAGYPQLSALFNYGQLGVHVFFYISGYVILLSLIKDDYGIRHFFKFLVKRSVRIDPAYITTNLLTLTTFWLLSFIPTFKGNVIPFIPGQFLAHILYYVPFSDWPFYNHVFWTLGIEFQFYLLIGGLYFISKSAAYKAIFLVLFTLSSFLEPPRAYYMLNTYAPLFALGMAAFQYDYTRHKLYLFCISFSLGIIFFKFGLIILTLVLAAALFVRYGKLALRALVFLGEISYSLYIIHPLVLILLLGVAKRLNLLWLNDLLILLVQLLILVAVAFVFFKIIEQPSKALSKKIKYH